MKNVDSFAFSYYRNRTTVNSLSEWNLMSFMIKNVFEKRFINSTEQKEFVLGIPNRFWTTLVSKVQKIFVNMVCIYIYQIKKKSGSRKFSVPYKSICIFWEMSKAPKCIHMYIMHIYVFLRKNSNFLRSVATWNYKNFYQ